MKSLSSSLVWCCWQSNPQILPKVVDPLKDTISTARPLLLSILAGITLHQLAESFVGWSIIRAMPNTPATVGVGVTALAAREDVTPQQIDQARQIFCQRRGCG